MEVRPSTGLGGSGEDGGRRAEWPELVWVCHARVLGSVCPLCVPAPSGPVGRSPSSLGGCEHSGNVVGTSGPAWQPYEMTSSVFGRVCGIFT